MYVRQRSKNKNTIKILRNPAFECKSLQSPEKKIVLYGGDRFNSLKTCLYETDVHPRVSRPWSGKKL